MKNKNVFLRVSLIVCALLITCLTFFVPSKIENGVSALTVESDYNFINLNFEEFYLSTDSDAYLSLSSLGDGVFRLESYRDSSVSFSPSFVFDAFNALASNFYGFYFNIHDTNFSSYLTNFYTYNTSGFSLNPFVSSSGFITSYGSVNFSNPFYVGKVLNDTNISSFTFSFAIFNNAAFYGQPVYLDFSLSYCDFGIDFPTNIFDSLDDYSVGYDKGYDEGYNYAIDKFGNIGYFNQSTFNAYFNGLNSFMFDSYQPVTSSYFTFGDGGIFFTNTGIYDYIIDNIVDQNIGEESGYISFLKVGLVSDYSKWSYSGMVFGNRVIFIFNDGSSEEFNVADGDLNYGTSYLDLSNHVGKSILEVQVYFANSDSAPGGNNTPIGLGSGTSYSYGFAQGYESGLKDNQSDVYDKGYAAGSSNGFTNGYNEGLATAENTSFFGLISAVIDVPLHFITSIFSFDILGVNISSFLFALLSIAIIITIIKLVSKNE